MWDSPRDLYQRAILPGVPAMASIDERAIHFRTECIAS
jgi:hypothetical protein